MSEAWIYTATDTRSIWRLKYRENEKLGPTITMEGWPW
jgi:hypothetical protein